QFVHRDALGVGFQGTFGVRVEGGAQPVGGDGVGRVHGAQQVRQRGGVGRHQALPGGAAGGGAAALARDGGDVLLKLRLRRGGQEQGQGEAIPHAWLSGGKGRINEEPTGLPVGSNRAWERLLLLDDLAGEAALSQRAEHIGSVQVLAADAHVFL